MDTQAERAHLPRWPATCAIGIVAATLLASCEQASDPNRGDAQPTAPTVHPRAADLYVDIDEGVVTVHAHDAPLHAVIEKLAQHARLQILMQEQLDERVTVELRSPTLAAAVRELLRGRGFILVEARKDSEGTLWILSNGSSGRSANPVSVVSGGNTHESAQRDELKSFEALAAGLTDRDSNARLDAVSELSDFGDEQAIMTLASIAAHDEHPAVRAAALHAIGGDHADSHRSVFTSALNDHDARVRKAAVSALEASGTQTSLQILAIALKDRDASVRATAVDAIGEIGGDAARRVLESALTDESAVVREAATEQLVQVTEGRVRAAVDTGSDSSTAFGERRR